MIASSKFFNLNENAGTGILDDVPYIEYSNESAMSDAFQIMYENEVNWNMLQEAIAINELTCFKETGMEMIYEGVDFRKYINSAVNFIKSLWTRFTNFIKGHVAKLTKWLTEDSKLGKAGRAAMVRGESRIAANKEFKIKGYEFNDNDDAVMSYTSLVSEVKDLIDRGSGEDSLYNDLKALVKSTIGYDSMGADGELSIGAFKTYLTGDSDRDIKRYCTVKHVDSETSQIKAVKSKLLTLQSEAKKGYDDAIRILKNFEKEAKKADDTSEEKVKAAHHTLEVVKKVSGIDLKLIATMLDVTSMRRKQNGRLIRSLIAAGATKTSDLDGKNPVPLGLPSPKSESAGIDGLYFI